MRWSLQFMGTILFGVACAGTACTFVACSDASRPSTSNAQGGSSGGDGGVAGSIHGGHGGAGGNMNGGNGGTAGAGGCSVATECNDGYACTVDECQSGVCSHQFDIFASCQADQYCDWVQNVCVDDPPCQSDADCVTALGNAPCVGVTFCDQPTHKCHFLLSDDDVDGHAPIACGGDDCDDKHTNVHPGGVEICDALDNDCNGTIDDGLDVNFNSPKSCGTCENNCYAKLLNADPTGIGCNWNGVPGTPGTCTCSKGCAPGWYDLNNDCICEYYCVKTGNDDSLCNNKDDDCDSVIDEDVNTCTSITDCGACGNACVVLHGTPQCVNNGNMPCSPNNTQCQIKQCDPNWWDIDKSYATGCEYACTLSNGGIELCKDGLDNDCDGQIDEGC